jgi:hypothetical protein
MLRLLAFLALFVFMMAPARQDDTASVLTRAHALYGEGKFEEARQLLLPLDESLRSQPEKVNDYVEVKLQLVLIHLGLEQIADAKSRAAELYFLDPDFSIRREQVGPEVIAIFEEARAQNKAVCSRVCTEADDLLEAAAADKILALIQTHGTRCSCLDALAKDAGEHFYRRSIASQKSGDLIGALSELVIAAKFDPSHAMIRSATEAIQGQLRATTVKVFQQWRSDMAAGQYGLAAGLYREMHSMDTDNAPGFVEQMRAGYRQQLDPAIKLWNEACDNADGLLMDRARRQALEVLPDPQFGQDLIDTWMVCAKKP